ncbi:MAG TPA: GNAT family N-acetyltransferase [Anaerolineales bacterium]|nr:GNAT family N-acetyltransferase [Anaerolineales bacterium]HND94027.1 GNAT family N-acetyltransferase [Anaerolineales bacterium]HNE70396.1 GNAT family N-acetyltransferase [Anaerolineales bacterium]HNF36906.1 GNAT family N-acetyltransferase [Anaerolineales bacterium]
MQQAMLNDFSTAHTVSAAIKTNWLNYHYAMWQSPKVELSISPYLNWLITDIPDYFLNLVVCTQLPEHGIETLVEKAMNHFEKNNVPRFMWFVEEGVQAENLKHHLAARGLTFRESFATKMAAHLENLSENISMPKGLEIVPVENRTTLKQWIHLTSRGFGIPAEYEDTWCDIFDNTVFNAPFRTYLGVLNGQPVGTAQLFTSAGVAGIYNITCAPEARCQGVATALTKTALLDARQLGYRVSVLQASQAGAKVYRKLGFQDYGNLSAFMWKRN